MHTIVLWSDIKGDWVSTINPLLMGTFDFATARSRVKNLQACKWQILKGNRPVAHGVAGN